MCQYIEKVLKETHQTIHSSLGGGGKQDGKSVGEGKELFTYYLYNCVVGMLCNKNGSTSY